MATRQKPATVDEYIEAAPEQSRAKLRELRALLKEVAPQASEALKWGAPVLALQRILFSYAAYKDHINFMPTGLSLDPFRRELGEFKANRETLQLPYDRPLPAALIRRIAEHRLVQVLEHDAKWMY